MSKGDKLIIEEKSGELRIKKASLLVNEIAGSVTIPKHLKKVGYNEAIKQAKKNRFKKQ